METLTPNKTTDIIKQCRSWIEENKDKDRAYAINEILAGGAKLPFKVKKVCNVGMREQPIGKIVEILRILPEGYTIDAPTFRALTDIKIEGFDFVYTCVESRQWKKV